MIPRLAHAYAMVQALLGSMIIVIIGLALEQKTVGVTRQPLPLVWPLGVLHVVVAQLPLPEILGSLERVAVRGSLARGVRAVLVLVLLTTGSVTYMSGNRALLAYFLTLAAAGFIAAAVSRADPWVWTLGIGMAGVGLVFITPLGGPISRFLESIPVPVAVASVGIAACVYVLRGWLPRTAHATPIVLQTSSVPNQLR